jgi:hypothetical protein
MANESVEGSLSFKILPEEIRKRFKGSMSYSAIDANDKWVYKKLQVTHSSAAILDTNDDYLMAPTTSVATGDKYKFLLIKHTGYTDSNENIDSVFSVMFSINDDTPAYNDSNLIVISPGDTIALKLPNCTVANLRAMTCSVTNGTPAADGTSGENALIEIAAILDDIA